MPDINQFKKDICQICYNKTKSQLDGKFYCMVKGCELKKNLQVCDEFIDDRPD